MNARTLAQSLARRLWRDWIRPLALPVLFVTAAKSALADINYVPSGSMQPTILPGDVVFINKLAYDLRVPFTSTRLARWSTPQRGDIVVCFSPDDGTRLVKRVIGLPGDVIELRDEILHVNGVPWNYTRLATTAGNLEDLGAPRPVVVARESSGGRGHAIAIRPGTHARRSFGPLVVPAGHHFILGDDRDNSRDSRYFGPVASRDIVGRANGVFVSADLNRWLRPRFERFCSALE